MKITIPTDKMRNTIEESLRDAIPEASKRRKTVKALTAKLIKEAVEPDYRTVIEYRKESDYSGMNFG